MTEIERLTTENERLKILLYNAMCMIIEDNENYDDTDELKERILSYIGSTESELFKFGVAFPNYDCEYEKDYSPNNPWDAPGMSIYDFVDFPIGF